MNDVLLTCALLATGATLVLAALWKSASQALWKEREAHQTTKTHLAAAVAAVKVSEARLDGERSRLEHIIAQLKTEIASLEASAPRDPAAVRHRLRELLGSAESGVPSPAPDASGGSAPGYGSVPFGSTPKP